MIPWRRKWQPTPVFLPGKFHGQRRLVGCSPWGHKESDTTELPRTSMHPYLTQPKSVEGQVPRKNLARLMDMKMMLPPLPEPCWLLFEHLVHHFPSKSSCLLPSLNQAGVPFCLSHIKLSSQNSLFQVQLPNLHLRYSLFLEFFSVFPIHSSKFTWLYIIFAESLP